MEFANDLLGCLCSPTGGLRSPTTIQPRYHRVVTEKPSPQTPPTPRGARLPQDEADIDSLATDIISILIRAEKPGKALTLRLNDAVRTTGWSERLAKRILNALEETLQGSHDTWGEVVSDAYRAAVEAGEELFQGLWEYAKAHPVEIAASVVLTLVAIGVLAVLMPWVLELLGFGAEGPVAGKKTLSTACGWC